MGVRDQEIAASRAHWTGVQRLEEKIHEAEFL